MLLRTRSKTSKAKGGALGNIKRAPGLRHLKGRKDDTTNTTAAHMSIEAIMWARSVTTGSVGRKAVLLVLADYADERGECFPSQQLIAEHTEQSVRTVQRQIADLEAAKLIRRERRTRRNGSRTSDRYVLSIGLGDNLSRDNDDRTYTTPVSGPEPLVEPNPLTPIADATGEQHKQRNNNRRPRCARHRRWRSDCRDCTQLTAAPTPTPKQWGTREPDDCAHGVAGGDTIMRDDGLSARCGLCRHERLREAI